ncbi:hypothetical protein AEST_30300 [Alishewanella aestuarii B11]|uniref:PEP-CTERM protein-sorting domain-containing protein n=1 Tax=Alishewanella aestuarii B11 TaxID=1197174 RepID=J1QFC5_9ALTE|nr:PEP-CTERM sorting domain-containing protein [Alishewanella aestuarii]EJI84196.1 hypothetical protein AEST_30300 [Alishewanella aestuarii B11]
MKYVTSFIGAAALAVASFNASAATVSAGGVVWDEVANGGVLGNFNFQQWYSTTAYGVGSQGQQTITSNTAVPILTPNAHLNGIGVFTSLNDGRLVFGNQYCAGEVSCALTFAFGGLKVASLTPGEFIFDTSAAWLNVYFQSPAIATAVNNSSNNNYNNQFANVQNGTLWASFAFDSAILRAQALTGSGGFFEAMLSVTGGLPDVVAALDRQNGMSDIYINTQAAFGTNGNYSSGGSGRVELIPAPASIALLGLGLLGLAGARRFKKA